MRINDEMERKKSLTNVRTSISHTAANDITTTTIIIIIIIVIVIAVVASHITSNQSKQMSLLGNNIISLSTEWSAGGCGARAFIYSLLSFVGRTKRKTGAAARRVRHKKSSQPVQRRRRRRRLVVFGFLFIIRTHLAVAFQ